MVEKDGKIVYARAVNDRRLGAEYTTETRIRIASCSKWLSAALVMTFVDEGRLSLDDTVGRWLPVLTVHGKGGITVRQCLAHLTGIREPPLRESLIEMRLTRSMDQAIDAIAELPMEGAPGKVFHYSSVGLQIAGAILEKIGGQSFEALFAARIGASLGMVNTDFGGGPVAMPAEAGGVGYGYGEWIMGEAVSSPELFGSFPWVDNNRGYCAFLMCFYLSGRGKQERYAELMPIVNEALQ
jgi:CubicO group peptidase (beta-lactamase class C family)